MMAGRKTLMRLDDVLSEIDASDWDNDLDFSSDDDCDLEADNANCVIAYRCTSLSSQPAGRGGDGVVPMDVESEDSSSNTPMPSTSISRPTRRQQRPASPSPPPSSPAMHCPDPQSESTGGGDGVVSIM
jgi:hypothetical protein